MDPNRVADRNAVADVAARRNNGVAADCDTVPDVDVGADEGVVAEPRVGFDDCRGVRKWAARPWGLE
jgi:hypothetical protein